MIMPGVTLHRNCIVLPGSVVTRDVVENSIVGGNPAKMLRWRTTTDFPSQSYNYWFAL